MTFDEIGCEKKRSSFTLLVIALRLWPVCPASLP